MDMEIESLLFKQVVKPKNYLMLKIHKLWDNRYRINVYTESYDKTDTLTKRHIDSSYFCHYETGKLNIIDGIKDGSKFTKSTF